MDTASSKPVIRVEKLTKYYGSSLGIEQVTFTVSAGEIFGFLGPNGAGKTTTIRMLLDLLRPTSGEIQIFGEALDQNSLNIRRRCGYLPGDFVPYGNLSGTNFLKFMAGLRRTSLARSESLLKRFDLTGEALGKKIKYLSHGMRQKLGITQAFAHDPELLILDEPTTGLDPLMQEKFYDLLREKREQGATVFLSSHNLPEVEKICDRVAIIRDGRLVALETLTDLKQKCFRKLVVITAKNTEPQLSQTELLSREGRRYEYLVKGDMQQLLQELAKIQIEDIIFPEPDLEEVFMTYYERGKS